MKITINGRFLTQPITGVQRYGIEIIKALDILFQKRVLDPQDWEIEVLVPRKCTRLELNLQHIEIKAVGNFSGYFWEQFQLPFFSRKSVLFCMGNLAPLISLLSKRITVITVHDLSYKYFPES